MIIDTNEFKDGEQGPIKVKVRLAGFYIHPICKEVIGLSVNELNHVISEIKRKITF